MSVIIQRAYRCEDLLRKLLCRSEDRLGNGGVEEIKRHPFFNVPTSTISFYRYLHLS